MHQYDALVAKTRLSLSIVIPLTSHLGNCFDLKSFQAPASARGRVEVCTAEHEQGRCLPVDEGNLRVGQS